jgi:hypothetical protein
MWDPGFYSGRENKNARMQKAGDKKKLILQSGGSFFSIISLFNTYFDFGGMTPFGFAQGPVVRFVRVGFGYAQPHF